MALEGKVRFEEIEVERINIVDRNGTLRLAIANTERSPDPVINGKPYTRSGGQMPGLIFFNDKGFECGGLVFRGRREDGGCSAGTSLTFDQFEQDQVVQLSYDDEGGKRSYGLTIMDRAPVPLAEVAEKAEAVKRMPDGPSKDQAFRDLGAELGIALRLFVGRNPAGEAVVMLADSKGRTRIWMRVDKDDVPRLEFLDEDGKVVYSLPPGQPR